MKLTLTARQQAPLPTPTIHPHSESTDLLLLERRASITRLIEFLRAHADEVLDLLTEHASHAAAKSELHSTLKALEGADAEVQRNLQGKGKVVDCMAVFMPSNLVLYFYALYLVIPSLYTRCVLFRPSSHVAAQTARLHRWLQPVHRLPLHLQQVSQRVFLEESVRQARLVLFTGTYANAERIRSQLTPDSQTYVFFGQGVNPTIIGCEADVELAARDLVSARMFNTGQDCMGPNVVFVAQQKVQDFAALLQDKLAALVFGSRKDPAADYGPIYYASTIATLSQYLGEHAEFIEFGGAIDFARRKIEPTILRGTLSRRAQIIEYFGPIFNIVSYDDETALMRELNNSFYKDRAMGASVYGSPALADFLRTNHMVAVDQTLFDIEDGNQPFGGHGQMANYIFHGRRIKTAPILLSQVVCEHL
jgi:aldehyde dehydrogenase (NAD+)